MSDEQYLVWSNEHRCWWRPNSAGYTLHVKSAGRYSREEALAIAKGSRRGWIEGRAPDEMAIAERDVLDAACVPAAVETLQSQVTSEERQCERCWQPATCKKYGCRDLSPASPHSSTDREGK